MIARLLDQGFRTLEDAVPLLRGMLFDASRHKLVEPSLERVCVAVEAIVGPDGARPRETIENLKTAILSLIDGYRAQGAFGGSDSETE